MRKVFIADAHLGKPGDFNYRTLLKFLEGLKGNTETLFILGDLFEFWIGYRNIPFTHYLPALAILKELRDSGTHIIYLEGNHDFHMGPFFEKTLKAEIYPGPVILSINGKKVYLCHGDQVLQNDHGYRAFRFLLHNPLTKILFPLVPYRLTSVIARHLSHQSMENHDERNRKWDYVTILKDFASTRFESGCDAVITAHFHFPFTDRSGADKDEKVLFCLGDWKTQFSYGEWIDGSPTLKKYSV
jgi:UDP-2,3-diacylglucosamine hydrolase